MLKVHTRNDCEQYLYNIYVYCRAFVPFRGSTSHLSKNDTNWDYFKNILNELAETERKKQIQN